MNLPVMIVAGLVAFAAPAGLLTYRALDEGAPVAPASASVAPFERAPAPGSVAIRIHHDGEPLDATLEIGRANESAFETRALTLAEGENVLEYAFEPVGAYWMTLDAAGVPAGPAGLLSGRFGGSASFDLAECAAVEVLFQTLTRGDSSGLGVPGAQCMPGPARHVSVETSGPTVAAPFPTCPLECSMSYSFGDAGRLAFDVPEGATRIDVVARWTAEGPFTRELGVWLLTPDDECGERCWRAVAAERGVEEVVFSYATPVPGAYAVSTHFTSPAGASVQQDVWLEAVVHTS